MKDIEQLFSEIKSNNKHEAKSIFDGIIADKVTKALDARKAAIAQQRFNESTDLKEGSMDKMSLQDLWMDFTGADFQVDQGYGIGKGSPKWNSKKQDAIYNHVSKKFGKKVADDMADYGATATYADEYADADEAPKAKKHLAKLAKKHGIKESTKELSEDDSYYALKDAERAAGGAAAFKKLSYGEQDALLSKEMEKLGYKKHPTRNTWVKK